MVELKERLTVSTALVASLKEQNALLSEALSKDEALRQEYVRMHVVHISEIASLREQLAARDAEWVSAIMPGNSATLIGRTYNTPEKYAAFAEAKHNLMCELNEEAYLNRLKMKRTEVADLRRRVTELLKENDVLRRVKG